MAIEWIESAGGPLIVLPETLRAEWHGYSQHDLDPLDPSHDYGRACQVNGYAGVISFAWGSALVLGDMPMPTAWVESGDGFLARWGYAPDHESAEAALLSLPDELEPLEVLTWDHGGEPLLVFDSALAGDAVEDQDLLQIRIDAHRVQVRTMRMRTTELWFIVHRFVAPAEPPRAFRGIIYADVHRNATHHRGGTLADA